MSGETFLALAELRGRLLWRRLRGRGGVPEVVSKIVTYAVVLPAAVAFAAAAGVAAFRAVRIGRGLFVDATVGALFFGIWQTWTAVSLSLAERDALDLKRLLVYPISPRRVWAWGMLASMVGDPFSIFWGVLLLGSFAGAALGRPGAWLLLLAATLAAFAVATVSLVALLQELLARMLRPRWTRAVAVAAVYLGALGLAVTSGGSGRSAFEALRVVGRLRWILFPAAFATEAGKRLYRGEVAAAAPWIAALAIAAALVSWVAYRLALAGARSGGQGTAGEAGVGRVWALPGVRGALVEKEAKYLLRHPLSMVLAIVMPGVAAVVAWKVEPRIPAEAGEVVRALPLFGFVLYTLMAMQPFWLNAFGWERGGVLTFLLAPVRPADAVLAKNATAYALALAVFVACAAAGIAVGGPPPLWALVGAFVLHAGIAPWIFAAGNLVSILNPRAAPMSLHRGGTLSALSGFAGMAILSAAAGLFALPVLLALAVDEPWALVLGWAVLGAAGYAVWAWSLPRVGRMLQRRREAFLAAVCGDEV